LDTLRLPNQILPFGETLLCLDNTFRLVVSENFLSRFFCACLPGISGLSFGQRSLGAAISGASRAQREDQQRSKLFLVAEAHIGPPVLSL
jgi:hypothetical protein